MTIQVKCTVSIWTKEFVLIVQYRTAWSSDISMQIVTNQFNKWMFQNNDVADHNCDKKHLYTNGSVGINVINNFNNQVTFYVVDDYLEAWPNQLYYIFLYIIKDAASLV